MDLDVARAVNAVAATNAPIDLADSQPAQKVFKHGGSTFLLKITANEPTRSICHHNDLRRPKGQRCPSSTCG